MDLHFHFHATATISLRTTSNSNDQRLEGDAQTPYSIRQAEAKPTPKPKAEKQNSNTRRASAPEAHETVVTPNAPTPPKPRHTLPQQGPEDSEPLIQHPQRPLQCTGGEGRAVSGPTPSATSTPSQQTRGKKLPSKQSPNTIFPCRSLVGGAYPSRVARSLGFGDRGQARLERTVSFDYGSDFGGTFRPKRPRREGSDLFEILGRGYERLRDEEGTGDVESLEILQEWRDVAAGIGGFVVDEMGGGAPVRLEKPWSNIPSGDAFDGDTWGVPSDSSANTHELLSREDENPLPPQTPVKREQHDISGSSLTAKNARDLDQQSLKTLLNARANHTNRNSTSTPDSSRDTTSTTVTDTRDSISTSSKAPPQQMSIPEFAKGWDGIRKLSHHLLGERSGFSFKRDRGLDPVLREGAKEVWGLFELLGGLDAEKERVCGRPS